MGNWFRLMIYPVRFVFFAVKLSLFRFYLVLVFCSREAAPFLVLLFYGIVCVLGWSVLGPIMRFGLDPAIELVTASAQGSSLQTMWLDVLGFIWPVREISVAVFVGLAGYVSLSLWQRILAFTLPAFPFPNRPLMPRLLWLPRPHRIETVACHITVPPIKLRYWHGGVESLTKQLSPALQHLIVQEDLDQRDASAQPAE